MNMIMGRLKIFRSFRQLHTIISQETIKPFSPTPPHHKTHNLSLIDRFSPNIHMPWVLFYNNYNDHDIKNLKKSLSQSLTQFYPFAGRLSTGDQIECNDEGVEFFEASQDSRLDDFILKKEQDESTYQLFPNGLGCIVGKSSPNLVEVQLNHFNGGGIALAVTISHKVGDATTMASFINHWATISRGGSPINPIFLSSSTNDIIKMPELVLDRINKVKYATRIFVFPNSKLNELKKKISSMDTALTNLTRVEVLTSLIFKCGVDAATIKSGFLNPSNLLHTVNMRNKILKNDQEKTAGNIFTSTIIKMDDAYEIKLNEVVARLRKVKKGLEGIKVMQEVGESLVKALSTVGDDSSKQLYASSSVCGIPFYEADFGWGKPVEVTLAGPNSEDKAFYFMDTPHKDGIVAIVHLPEDEMLIFQENKELLAYVKR